LALRKDDGFRQRRESRLPSMGHPMDGTTSRVIRTLLSGACVVWTLGFVGCGGAVEGDAESVGEVTSRYTEDGNPHSPVQWICDLPMHANYQVYAPNQEEEYLNECKNHTDYDVWVACYEQTDRPCCLWENHSHPVSYSNQTWYCGVNALAWRHVP
jgi:hypothetical protein